jgi:hypothetical protein
MKQGGLLSWHITARRASEPRRYGDLLRERSDPSILRDKLRQGRDGAMEGCYVGRPWEFWLESDLFHDDFMCVLSEGG